MSMFLLSSFDRLRMLLRSIVCVLGIAMLLLMPAVRSHDFGAHFRNPEVRRTAARHTSIAHSDSNLHAQVAQCSLLPPFFASAEPARKITPRYYRESPAHILLYRVFSRMKLNPSGSGGQDPLLIV